MAAALAFALTGCVDEEPRLELLPSGIAHGNPVDTTEPGELPEGTLVAFGLKLPRRMKLVAKMDDAVFAVGQMRLEDVANYIRRRVDTDEVDTGPSKTRFVGAKVRGGDKTVDIEVAIVPRGVQVVVRDRTRKPAEEGLSEKDRWDRVGLTPDGKLPKNSKLE